MIYDIVFWAFMVTVVVMALHLFYDFLVAPLLRDLLRSLVVRRRSTLIERCRETQDPTHLAAGRRLIGVIDRIDRELRTVTLRSLSKLSVNAEDLNKAEFEVEEAGPDFIRAAMDVKMAVFVAALVNTGLAMFYAILFIFPMVLVSEKAVQMWRQANRSAEGIAFGA